MPDDARSFRTSSIERPERSAADRAVRPSRLVMSAAARLSREPLFHFALLGALIFGIDRALHPPPKDDKVITVSKAMRQSFIDNFDEDKARVPSDADVEKMVDSWVASEILYREGKALGVDRGDDMIRDRIAFKMQLLIFDQIRVPEPTEAQLRAWFADNHARFDEQELVGFYLTPPTDQATAQRDALLAMPEGQWNLLQSKDGWHVVRLDSRRPGAIASFESVRDEATKIWHTEETRNRAWEAVKRLKASYQVRNEP
jgi:hypothetical protein